VYWVRIKHLTDSSFSKYFFDVDPAYKNGLINEERTSVHKLRLSVASGIQQSDIEDWAERNEVHLIDLRALAFGIIDAEVPETSLPEVFSSPWISFIQNIPQDEEVNYRASMESGAGV
jgi:hypothetical protein